MRCAVAAAIGILVIAAAAAAWAQSLAGAARSPATATSPAGAASCTGCHPASPSVTSPVPRLAGLDRAGIVRAMQEFRTGQRAGTVMDRIAKGFTDAEIEAIAAWYAGQK